jgi:3-(3-hydroxy-phenyl)propionate hydroxylase
VRRHSGLGFEGKTFTQDWLIIDAMNVPNRLTISNFFATRAGPRRTWSLRVAGNGGVMLQPGETREQMETPEKIRELLAPWCKPEDIARAHGCLPIPRTHRRSLLQGRAFLVGDAAHITPPFVGQGLVAGLRDVANLC